MKQFRKLISLLLASVLSLLLVTPASAYRQDDPRRYIQEMIGYYLYYEEAAATDLQRLFEKLNELDPEQGALWSQIFDYWYWANRGLTPDEGVLSSGLPEDDSLCIAVLGYALKPRGEMKDELIGRLETALASAEKYPNAYILCTGGGTAQRRPGVTEAGQMAMWLQDQGIDPDRIIVEDESTSTSQNARYSMRILHEEYPQVRHLALVTSHYHMPRAAVYFYTEELLRTAESRDPFISLDGYAVYQASHDGSETVSMQAEGVASLAGIAIDGLPRPRLSKLIGLELYGQCVYDPGESLNLSAVAVYDSDYSRDVTELVEFSRPNMNRLGVQRVEASYQENGREKAGTFDIEIRAAQQETSETTPAEPRETVPTAEPPGVAVPENPGKDPPPILWAIFFLFFFATVALLLIRKKRSKSSGER